MGVSNDRPFCSYKNDLIGPPKSGSFNHEYRVQCKIGEGSFSEVLKCQDRHSGLTIAAKQLKKTFRSATHASELPELVAMRKLTKHPNILHMLESHFDPLTGRVTLIFELMEMSLYDLMKNRKRCIPETRAKNYLYQIVKGVDHIHHHGIFHRDIKPENILVKGPLLKISDLGSIKGIYTKHPYTEYISTRWYRSPECLMTTGFYGPKMDVWAIGCVFFELLTLKPLFPGANELDQIAKINAVLGMPSPRLLAKFKRHKSRNSSGNTVVKQGTGLNPLLPLISEAGRDIMRQMIVYDPDARTNIRRLMEHKYFSDLRDAELMSRRMSLSNTNRSLSPRTSWRNPVLLSYLTSENRRKPKRKLSDVGTSKDIVECRREHHNIRLAMRGSSTEDEMAPTKPTWGASNFSVERLRARVNKVRQALGAMESLETTLVTELVTNNSDAIRLRSASTKSDPTLLPGVAGAKRVGRERLKRWAPAQEALPQLANYHH